MRDELKRCVAWWRGAWEGHAGRLIAGRSERAP